MSILKEKEKQNIVKRKFFIVLGTLLVAWVILATSCLMVVIESQQAVDQSAAFRGRYLNMSIEGLSVLQQQLSKTNVRLSAVESEIEKGKKAPEPMGEGETSFIQRRCKEGK